LCMRTLVVRVCMYACVSCFVRVLVLLACKKSKGTRDPQRAVRPVVDRALSPKIVVIVELIDV
jgi:hypothetical protein